mmetsp:Transcript_25372/g.84516  ORF Transcript_25372/g.84516 Transcript_25372/m.84516 type:complete len:182 (-) Transcript_25372:189-734(-)
MRSRGRASHALALCVPVSMLAAASASRVVATTVGAAAAASVTAAASVAAAAAAAAPSQPALPSASDLGLPDSWTSTGGDSDDEQPTDPKGTRYNAVPLPSSLAAAAGPGSRHSKSHMPAALPISTPGGPAEPPAKRRAVAAPQAASGAKKALLPPQLRRPNVVTEDARAWSSKQGRPKPRE